MDDASLSHKASLLLGRVRELIALDHTCPAQLVGDLALVAPAQLDAARNLLTCLRLRSENQSQLVAALRELCLDAAPSELSAMATLVQLERVLRHLCHAAPLPDPPAHASSRDAQRALDAHRTALFGPVSGPRYTAIMVTLDPASVTVDLLRQLLAAGMDCVRINTAHDSPRAWQATLEALAEAERGRERPVALHVDLAGPKLRTLPIAGAGSQVRRVRPKKDVRGRVVTPALLEFGDGSASSSTCVPCSFSKHARVGDSVQLVDARGKQRRLYVVQSDSHHHFVCEVFQTTYIEAGNPLSLWRGGHVVADGRAGALPVVDDHVTLNVGSRLALVGPTEPGSQEEREIPVDLCGATVAVGDTVLLDDGQVSCTCVASSAARVELRVDRCRVNFKLKHEKGINLPQSTFPDSVCALTTSDLEHLRFFAALMPSRPVTVGLSFVRAASDVRALHGALRQLGVAEHCATCVKIETAQALKHLPNVLLACLWEFPTAVMIARGDLAGEIGMEHLASAQDDVGVLAAACHLPVIFATQVLESLNKNGIASRAEITDVALQGAKAEAIMLNKGPHLVRTVATLHQLLEHAPRRQHKQAVPLRTLTSIDLKHYK